MWRIADSIREIEHPRMSDHWFRSSLPAKDRNERVLSYYCLKYRDLGSSRESG